MGLEADEDGDLKFWLERCWLLVFLSFFFSLFAMWADLTSVGIFSSNPGGNKGPDEKEEEVFGLGLRSRLKRFEMVMF